jgi:hypothetical protein
MLVAYLMVLVMLSTGLAGLPARADQATWQRLPIPVRQAIEREVPPWTAVAVLPTADGNVYVVSWHEGHRRIEIRLDRSGRLAAPAEAATEAQALGAPRR